MREQLTLRMAHPADVASIVALVNGYASDSVMLPISAERVALALDDFVVAVDAQGGGVGRRVVAEVEALAQKRGIVELFALTMTAGFFESVGYEVTERARYPEKIRRDCASCPRCSACNEVCVARLFRADTLEFAA